MANAAAGRVNEEGKNYDIKAGSLKSFKNKILPWVTSDSKSVSNVLGPTK